MSPPPSRRTGRERRRLVAAIISSILPSTQTPDGVRRAHRSRSPSADSRASGAVSTSERGVERVGTFSILTAIHLQRRAAGRRQVGAVMLTAAAGERRRRWCTRRVGFGVHHGGEFSTRRRDVAATRSQGDLRLRARGRRSTPPPPTPIRGRSRAALGSRSSAATLLLHARERRAVRRRPDDDAHPFPRCLAPDRANAR